MNNLIPLLFITSPLKILSLIRQWLESVEINSPLLARFLCKIIPASCPFEREVKLFRRTIIAIPPLCKLNPFYQELMLLRYKSLVYLAEQCGEDTALDCR
jgi:hypothetical protein